MMIDRDRIQPRAAAASPHENERAPDEPLRRFGDEHDGGCAADVTPVLRARQAIGHEAAVLQFHQRIQIGR